MTPMTADAGDVDRVLWQGASAPPRDTGRRIRFLLAAMGAAVIVAAGVLFVTGLLETPGAWVIAAAFLMLVLFRTSRTVEKEAPEQRFTLTSRQLIVESDGGREVYDLGQLGELTVDARPDGTGDIGVRSAPLPLAHDIPDAPALLHRIESARAELMEPKTETNPGLDDEWDTDR